MENQMINKHIKGRMTYSRNGLAVLGFIVVLMFSPRSFAQHPAPSKESLQAPPHGPSFVGKRARHFVLRDLSGQSISLRDFAGKPVIVNFWATWCPPCLQEMPWFQELTKENAESGLTILGLSLDIESNSATPEKIAATVKRLGVTYPILLPDESIHALYGPV
jgi:thiol-disulfide isomerase/thioredoxin